MWLMNDFALAIEIPYEDESIAFPRIVIFLCSVKDQCLQNTISPCFPNTYELVFELPCMFTAAYIFYMPTIFLGKLQLLNL
mmetsp:Transcript_10488/g.15583  ORF Transcript_10488/g.15583 Transcript_10488/m.15583 type:complete len:81 (+) Transcript_10488:345-587(+)